MSLIESHYTLNVAKAMERVDMHGNALYSHYCRVELGPDKSHAVEVSNEMMRHFPAPEYKCSLMYVKCEGVNIPL
jgi:hypothetical protein